MGRTAQPLLLFIAVAAAYYALSRIGLEFIEPDVALAVLWPASGLALAVALRSGPAQWWVVAAAVAVGNVVAQLEVRSDVALSVALAGVNATEPVLAAAVALRVAPGLAGPWESTPRHVLGIVVAASAGNAATALAGAMVVHIALGAPLLDGWVAFLIAHGIGMVALAPLVLAAGRLRRDVLDPATVTIALGALAVVAAVFVTDADGPWHHSFPVFPLFLWLAFRGRSEVTVVTLGIATIVMSLAAIGGRGPFDDVSDAAGMAVLQGFLATLVLCTLAVEAAVSGRRAAEQRALAAERRAWQLLEAAPDAMVVAGPDGNVLTVNAEVERMFGYRRDELVGRPVEVLVPAAVRRAHRAHRGRYFDSPATRSMAAGVTLHGVRKDGRELPVEISLSPLETEDGTLVTAAIRDVSDRMRDQAEQAALRRVAVAVAEDVGAAAVFGLVAEEVARLLALSTGVVVRFEPDATTTLLASWTADGEPTTAPALRLEDGHVVAADGGVAAPITVGGRLWGAIGGGTNAPAAVRDDAEDRLARFAELVATAIGNALAWETLARHAATDAVTGLANHRTFHQRLAGEIERAQRYGRQLSVVLFDIDHFKAVNDTLGHHTGDRVLVEVGHRLAGQAREGEVVARVGGEEFAWLLPETDADGAAAAAERARACIAATEFGDAGHVTVSAGVCSLADADQGGPDTLLRFADRALYWAKDHGRNAVFRYTDEAQRRLQKDRATPAQYQSMSSIRALARAIDAKDVDTRSHSERVAALSEQLALHLGWTLKQARGLHAAALLHDVGKIGVPDAVLLKPARLNEDEMAEVRRHPAIGAQIVSEVLDEDAVRWVRHHHERWDGSGYPDGLAGDAIPEGAQVLALADAWDVMTHTRSYQPLRTTDEALEECRREAAHQFAPEVVRALLRLAEEGLLPSLEAVDEAEGGYARDLDSAG